MSITPLRFTGVSNFSTDFQAIVDRAVAIATLPIKQMQNQQSDLIIKKQSLSTLGTSLQSVVSAIRDLGQTASDRAITATSSNTTKVTVQMTGVAAATAYTVTEIESIARQASESTLTGYADTDSAQVDADGILELVIGEETHEIDLTDYGNNLDGLKQAINDLGVGVRASIVNTGGETDPYYLAVTATSSGETTLQLRGTAGDALTNLVTAANQGTNARFKLNGLQIEKTDNAISDVVEGLTFNILSTTEPGESIVLNLASNRGTLATKITAFVAAYNSAMAVANSHVGENAGLLSGDNIIGNVQRALRGVANYRDTSGGIKSLADLGVEVDKQGVMTFNTSKFYSLTNARIDDAFTFFGSISEGFGATYSQIDALSNPFSGAIQKLQSDYDRTDTRLSKQIEIMAERVTQMQTTLSMKLQLADTLLAQLEGQQKMLETSIKSIEMVTYGKQDK